MGGVGHSEFTGNLLKSFSFDSIETPEGRSQGRKITILCIENSASGSFLFLLGPPAITLLGLVVGTTARLPNDLW